MNKSDRLLGKTKPLLVFVCSLKLLLVAVLLTTTITKTVRAKEAPVEREVSVTNSSSNLLLAGKQLYDRGNLVAAARIWQQAQQEYQNRGETTNLIHSNNYLATVYQDLGNWQQAEKAIADNLALVSPTQPSVTRRNTSIDSPLLYAQTLNTQGSWQLKQGKGQSAFATWQQSEAIYRQLQDTTGIILSQINQAQALQSLGYYRRAQKTLSQVQTELNKIDDPTLKIAALNSFAGTLEVSGDINQAETILKESLSLGQTLNSPEHLGETYFRLGNLARLQQQPAIEYYQQAIALSPYPQTKLEARLNLFSELIATKQIKKARDLVPTIETELTNSSLSRAKVYAGVNYATSLKKIDNSQAKTILETSIQQAAELQDKVAQAHAIGELGHWHELKGNYSRALELTESALALAQATQQAKITANLHWQKGRMLKQQGKKESAIAAYELAVKDIDNLNRDLVAVSNLQFSFRQQIEPIYRQLVELLLSDVDNLNPQQKQQYLEKSRLAIEALQQKELENFFHVACLDVNQKAVDNIDPQAAIIYPILLDRSVEIILSLPGQPLQHYQTEISSNEQQQLFDDLLQYLNPIFSQKYHLPTAQKLYDLLIRPVESILDRQEIATLVFVLDGRLRSLPMSVLHDGKQYLVEKYHLALTPGLQLLPNKSDNLDRLKVLTGGLTEARQGFSALPGVKKEIDNIERISQSKTLLNDRFTKQNLQQKIIQEPSPIVHLATHGQFSSNAEDTYILTWNDRIQVNDFDRLLNSREQNVPIELLVLSACKTAAGDERAILGLAGMAIRSGARSTMATLWSVNDDSTSKLMTEFYRYLNQPNTTKAQAMQQAQLTLLQTKQYAHPYYWSPFVLVGNWQ